MEASVLINLGRLVIDAAKTYRDARRKTRTLRPTDLINLHERFTLLSRSTRILKDRKANPSLTYDIDELRHKWLRDLNDAVDAIGEVDVATLRVYSPEIAEILQSRIRVNEAEVVHRALDEIEVPSLSDEQRKQLLRFVNKIESQTVELQNAFIVPVFLDSIANDDLESLAQCLDNCCLDLRSFIKENWPVETL